VEGVAVEVEGVAVEIVTNVVRLDTWLGTAPRRVVEVEAEVEGGAAVVEVVVEGGAAVVEVVVEGGAAVVEVVEIVTNVGNPGILPENAHPALVEVHCLLLI
jgi:hypothetical protein